MTHSFPTRCSSGLTDDYGYSKKFWMDESASITAFAREAIFGLAEQGAQVEATDEVWEHPIPAFAALGEAFASVAFAPPVQDGPAEREARNAETGRASCRERVCQYE